MHKLLSFVRSSLLRSRFEAEMDGEMREHMRAFRDDLIGKGIDAQEAERRARLEFGPVQAIKEECRESKGLNWPDALGRDARYAFRQIRKSPAFALTSILTLALCVGANTAIYSVVDGLLFRPAPYPEPDRLGLIATKQHSPKGDYLATSQDGEAWEHFHEHATTVEVAASSGGEEGVSLSLPGSVAQYVKEQRVSSGFFSVLGVQPSMGREIAPEEDRTGGRPVVVLSHALWNRIYGSGATELSGRKILLRGEPYEVIGVMPEGFRSTSGAAELWAPLIPQKTGEGGGTNYTILARLRPGITWNQAESELTALANAFYSSRKLPAGVVYQFQLIPLQRGLWDSLMSPLLLLWAAVVLVLLIGCVNVAGLMLARGVTRTHEIATRMALGSGRAAILRQLLVESLLIGLAGGAAGIALGFLALEGMKGTLLAPLSITDPISINLRVLLAMTSASLVTSLIFGLYPAVASTRVDLRSAMASCGRGLSTHRGPWARRVLVVAEVALGMVLLVGAGLMLRTLSYLTGLNPGYDGHGVLAANLSLKDARYKTTEAIDRLFRTSLANIRSQPGVESAGVGLTLPYERALNLGMQILDGPRKSQEEQITNLIYVTPGYLEALRIPVRQGRLFRDSDGVGAQPVVAINEAFVRRYFRGDEIQVGRHINLGKGDPPREIIAIVGDVQERSAWGSFGPLAPMPEIYIPASQLDDSTLGLIHTWFSPNWVVRSNGPIAETAAAMRSAVQAVDPQLPFAEFRTMDEIRSNSVGLQRLESILFGLMALLALVLVSVGVFGLIAHSVEERSREFGIRLALGSSAWRAIGIASLPGIVLTAVGIGAGFLLARVSGQVLQSILWGVRPSDPFTFVAVAGILLLTAGLASLIPSMRIARIDPVDTLKEQ